MIGKIAVLLLLVFMTLLHPFQAWSEKLLFISSIKIVGGQGTQRSVILEELGFDKDQEVSKKQILEGIENIYRTQLFTSVAHKLEDAKGGKRLVLTLEERWTTIPILKVSSGGGVGQVTVGVYDPNVYGQRLELGGQYEKLGDTQSGVVWLKKPRLLGRHAGLNVQVWNINRLRTKYKQEAEEPVVKTGFLQARSKYYLGIDHSLTRRLTGQLFYEYNKDSFSDKFTSDEVKDKIAIKGLPPETRYHFLGLGLELGKLSSRDKKLNGSLLGLSYRYGHSEVKELDDFWQLDLSYKYNYTTSWGAILAQRLLTGFTTAKAVQYWYYLGGLDRIRGFADNRFAGRYFWLSNSEYRHFVLKKNWLYLQGVAFLDVASTGEHFKQLDAVSGASVGFGLRLILPKVYRFAARIDYAKPIERTDDMNISFGVQQFF